MRAFILKQLALTLGAAALLGISGTATAAASGNTTQPQRVTTAPASTSQSDHASTQGAFDGLWAMTQSNGWVGQMFNSTPDPTGHYTGFTASSSTPGMTGTIDGQLSGNDVLFDIRWTVGHTRRYFGHRGTDGRWSGTTVDLNDPSSQATWFAYRP
jgi:hypothetical protein